MLKVGKPGPRTHCGRYSPGSDAWSGSHQRRSHLFTVIALVLVLLFMVSWLQQRRSQADIALANVFFINGHLPRWPC